MRLEELRESLPDFAKDMRLNLSTVLTEAGAPGLTLRQIWGIALAAAFATRHPDLYSAIAEEAGTALPQESREAAKGAATMMAMNNVYYRTTHLLENKDVATLPAKLRMNLLARPGVERVEFELYCFGVSAIAGCGACLNSHAHELLKAGITTEGIQSCLRIAAVINGVQQALLIR